MAELNGRVALVTGGGRGIGANIARDLAAAGMRVAVSGRTAEDLERVASEIGGLALVGDVSSRADVERMVAETERELGPIDLLVCNAGVADWDHRLITQVDPDEWWRVFEINVLGVFLCCLEVLRGMVPRGRGRIVNLTSGAAYRPGGAVAGTSYGPSKAAVYRFSELLAAQVAPHGITVFPISPGLVKTAMTEDRFPPDAPWTPPELAPKLVRSIAEGKLDRLSGRYIHAEHDDPDDVAARADEIVDQDLNAIRLQR